MHNVRLERRGDDLHVIIPLWGRIEARPSGTGRSTVLASTEGVCDLRAHSLQAKVPVMLEVNLYIPKGEPKP